MGDYLRARVRFILGLYVKAAAINKDAQTDKQCQGLLNAILREKLIRVTRSITRTAALSLGSLN